MKISQANYKFLLSLRKFRVWLEKNLTLPIFLRWVSVLLIAVAIFFSQGPNLQKDVGNSKAKKPEANLVATPGPKLVRAEVLPPNFLGKAALVVDTASSATLFEKNSQAKLPPASLAKLMTALLVLEKKPLNEATTISLDCAKVDGLKVGLPAGERFTVEALLKALLLPSASDAACALGEVIAGTEASPSSVFVRQMNQKAQALGLKDTFFTNTAGLDGDKDSDENYSTVSDLLKLVKENLKYSNFRAIVAAPVEKITSLDQTVSFDLKNTNELLARDSGFKGIKTGSTPKALGCLAFLYEKNGHQIIGIILGSPDRFLDAQSLVKWIFENYRWQ